MKSNYGDMKLEKCCQSPSNWMFRNKNQFYRKIAVHFSSCVAMFKLSVRQHWKCTCRPRMNLLELLNQLSMPPSLWPWPFFFCVKLFLACLQCWDYSHSIFPWFRFYLWKPFYWGFVISYSEEVLTLYIDWSFKIPERNISLMYI